MTKEGDAKDLGAPGYDPDVIPGRTFLLLGKKTGWSGNKSMAAVADITFYDEVIGDSSGTSISSDGDVNGDNNTDIFIGAPNNDEGGVDAGQAYLIFDFTTLFLPLLSMAEEPSVLEVWLPVIISVPLIAAAAVVAVVVIYVRKNH